jgi:nicotinamide phosphoribosyltransferase
MKDLIVANNVKLVVRPDSGEPSEVLPKIFQILQEGFGVSVNSKGFKVLNDGVKVLWGDGINETSCIQLFDLVLKLFC